MRVSHIYISGHRLDLRFTRCSVTSIRKFYPDIPITLIKDELHGRYDTSDLERLFGVRLFDTPVKSFGWGMAKLEPLFLPKGDRCLILDSDIVFAGRVLDELDGHDADFIVERCDHSLEDIHSHYFNPEVLAVEYPGFYYPGWVFNFGHFVANTGILTRADFDPFVVFDEPRRVIRPDLFTRGDQGFLNFVVFQKQRRGELSIDRANFMKWPPAMRPGSIQIGDLDTGHLRFLMHWAGPKTNVFRSYPMAEVLTYFEVAYYRRLHGR